MSLPKKPIIIIPSRLNSLRLPNKPLADIQGEKMIILCLRRAQEADVGPVVVACADHAIYEAVKDDGGYAVMTNPAHSSGSDRIFEALSLIDSNGKHDCVINFQGDMPLIDPKVIKAVLEPLSNNFVDISTLISKISDLSELENENVVKAVVGINDNCASGRALYFSRSDVPWGNGPKYHHIGVYAYRRNVLEKFVSLPRGILEQQERLEQLRALENGLRIEATLVDTVPLGVDTLEDLEKARYILGKLSPKNRKHYGK